MEILEEVRAVVMDLDDTLISAYRRPDRVWRMVCQRFQSELGPLEPDEAVRALTRAGEAFWGDPKRHALGRLDPLGTRRIIVGEAFQALRESGRRPPSREIAERMADAFSLQRDRDMRLEPGADAVLVHLRKAGYRLALLTNGTGPLQRAKIERFDLTSRFHHIQIEGEVGVGKPDSAAFSQVFEALDVDPAAVCVVGDSLEWDIRPARMLGCRTVLYDPEAPSGEEGDRGEADIVARTLESLAIHLPGLQRLPPEAI
ncbi:MAG: HAD family hydrolase [Alphaproteobacteria bacterium]|nr:HAD family hydrolase [Alphaproteobacteria bacterium]MBU2208697.1 HAD family hydrolase [Alphaproteobacteria bacterium]